MARLPPRGEISNKLLFMIFFAKLILFLLLKNIIIMVSPWEQFIQFCSDRLSWKEINPCRLQTCRELKRNHHHHVGKLAGLVMVSMFICLSAIGN